MTDYKVTMTVVLEYTVHSDTFQDAMDLALEWDDPLHSADIVSLVMEEIK
jgi:hypothetical protein